MRMLWKHAVLLWSFFRASAISDLEYRLNIAVKVGTDIIWYAAQILIFEVLFRHTDSISGWTIESTRVFMGVLFVVDACWMVLFSENLDRLSEKIRRGDLDLLLVKPVNSQFMMSFQKANVAYVFNLFLSFSWLIWALWNLPQGVNWLRLPLLIVLVPCSLAIVYGIRFFFSASALIFTRAENINYLWYQIYRLGTRPDAIYPPWLRYAVLSVVPVGFLASVPARILIETPDPLLFAATFGIAAISIWISTMFWRYALTFYSSASS